MKCEKCEKELAGGAVICRDCGFNNALQRAWRLKHGGSSPGASAPRQSSPGGDATLIPFPVALQAGSAKAAGGEREGAGRPDWRTQVKEKVRQSRERRHLESPLAEQSREASSLDPRVRSAVGRIRRVASPPTTLPLRQTTQATARLVEYQEEAARVVEPPRPAPSAPPEPRVPIRARVTTPLRPEPIIPVMMRQAQPLPEPEPEPLLPAAQTAPLPAPEPPLPATLEPLLLEEEIDLQLDETPEAPSWEESLGVEQPEVPEVSESTLPGVRRVPAYREPASLRERIIAGVLDLYIIAASYLPFFALFSLLDAKYSRGSLLLMTCAAIGLAFVYHFLMYIVASRTGGMAWRKLQIAGPTGEPILITRRRAVRRAVGSTVALVLAPLNLLVIWSNVERLGLADRLSDTIVVKQRPH